MNVTIEEINREISDLRSYINDYHKSLNDEGVWLFLASLGCWSVTDSKVLQFSATVIAILLFTNRVSERFKEKRTFPTIIKSIELRISDLPDGDSKKARYYDIWEIKSKELSLTKLLKKNWVFLLCWLFLAATFANALGYKL